MDGTEDDVMWSDSEEDGNVRSEHEEDEGSDCENYQLKFNHYFSSCK
jgi:hypothetical protein